MLESLQKVFSKLIKLVCTSPASLQFSLQQLWLREFHSLHSLGPLASRGSQGARGTLGPEKESHIASWPSTPTTAPVSVCSSAVTAAFCSDSFNGQQSCCCWSSAG